MIGSRWFGKGGRVETQKPKRGTSAVRYAVETLESRRLLAALIGVTGNGVSIADNDTTPNRDDFTDYGPMNVSSGFVTRQYIITNTGDQPLTFTNPVITGANAGDFTITTAPTTVPVGSTGNFVIRFDPSAAGTRTATFSVNTSDPARSPFNFSIQGTGLAMTTSSTGLQSVTTSPGTGSRASINYDNLEVHYTGYLLNGTKFDSSKNPNRTTFKFMLGNDEVIDGWDEGMLSLKLGEKRTLIVPPSLGYGNTPNGNIPANSTLIFEVEMIAFRDARVEIKGNGSQSNVNIVDGDNTPSSVDGTLFQGVTTVGGSLVRTFAIKNTSGDPEAQLAATSTPPITITGTDADDFTVGGLVGDGQGGATFTVTFKPRNGTQSVRNATITFHNNDPLHKAFDFAVQGRAVAAPSIGIFRNGLVVLDSNGSKSPDSADAAFFFGQAGDVPVAGDFNGDGITDIGVYRGNQFILDATGARNGSNTTTYTFGIAGDKPIVGDWNGDGKAEIGVFRDGVFYLDTNGNGVWELNVDTKVFYGTATNTPIAGDWNGDGITDIGVHEGTAFFIDSNGDRIYQASDANFHFGQPGNIPIVGDWNGDGKADIGVKAGVTFTFDFDGSRSFTPNDWSFNVGTVNDVPIIGAWTIARVEDLGVWRTGSFVFDADGSQGVTSRDKTQSYGLASDVPVVGDWLGDGVKRPGVFRGNQFILDTNADGVLNAGDATFAFGIAGDKPVIGDWNGDGKDEVGVFRDGVFYLDTNGSRAWELGSDAKVFFGQPSNTPISGDWNGDGITDIGVHEGSTFFLDSNGDRTYQVNDAVFNYGQPGDKPLAGDFNGDGMAEIGVFRAGQFFLDTNGSRKYESTDLLITYGTAGDTPLVGRWMQR